MKFVNFVTCICISTMSPAFAGEISQPLELATVESQQVDYVILLDGKVEAVNRSTLSAQTSGQVTETLVDVGDLVQKGTIILKLRDTEQQAEVNRAAAAVESISARLVDAEKEYQRIKGIHERKLVSQSALDGARASRDSAEADVKAARARLARAEEQLGYTQVTAPYTGIVEKRLVEVGESVSPGTPLYSGMSLDKVRVIANIPQSNIDAVRKNRQASVYLEPDTPVRLEGDSLTFFAYADPNTSSFRVRVNLPEGTLGLYPGMYLKTSFKIGERQTLTIPIQSVVHRASLTAVYVAGKSGVEFRQVRLGEKLKDGRQEVLSGLAVNERIALVPEQALATRQSQVSAGEAQ